MISPDDKVYKNQMAYNLLRDDLCETEHAGKYVLFQEEVIGFFQSVIDAYNEGIRLYGYDGGFVIDRVEPQKVIHLPSIWTSDTKVPTSTITVSTSSSDQNTWVDISANKSTMISG